MWLAVLVCLKCKQLSFSRVYDTFCPKLPLQPPRLLQICLDYIRTQMRPKFVLDSVLCTSFVQLVTVILHTCHHDSTGHLKSLKSFRNLKDDLEIDWFSRYEEL